MASATTNRPNGSLPGPARRTQFGDFSTAGSRLSENEKSQQSSMLDQNIGNGIGNGTLNWSTSTLTSSSAIWGKTAIGSGFVNGKKDVSRNREDDYTGSKGSGSLTASSEADPWGRSLNGGPWNTETSPTTTHSTTGSSSPIRHRSSILNNDMKISSPYFTSTHHAAIGLGSSTGYGGRSQKIQSNLNPASGTFKNTPSFASFSLEGTKENPGIHPSLEVDHSPRAVRLDSRSVKNTGYLGLNSRESSLPPSRHSESGQNITSNNPSFGSVSNAYGNYSHTPTNSVSYHRPSLPTPSQNHPFQNGGRSYTDSTLTTAAQAAELSQNFSRFSFSEKPSSNGETSQSPSNNEQSYALQNGYSYYDFQSFPQSSMYGSMTDGSKGYGSPTPDGYPEQPFAHQYSASFRVSRNGERNTQSPAGSDYRRGLSTPYYSTGGTPPTDALEQYRSTPRDLRVQANGDPISYVDRKLRGLHPTQNQQFYPYAAQFQSQYPTNPYDHTGQNFSQSPGYRFDNSVAPYVPNGPAASGHIRDPDAGHGIRSLVLDEFRNNSKANKRYELKDIYNHVVEFSGDQHGSRFIQSKLETANSDEKEQIFMEIQDNALQLMTDVFGNYVIQKLFEHGNQVQKRALAAQMRNHVNELSLQMYGCRVVQKALEHVLANQQVELVRELQNDVLKCVKDQNGNHVIQKALERVPTAHIKFIIEAFRGQVHTLSTHPYGCRVIQRLLENCSDQDRAAVLEELHQCAPMLITDQFGNYVAQHVIVHGTPADRDKIINLILGQLLTYSKHKFASNVVEKSIIFGTEEQRATIISGITTPQTDKISPLQLLMKDQFGNYVIQKLLGQLKGAARTRFIDDYMRPQLLIVKKTNYGKQIAALEKLIFTGPHPPTQPSAMTAAMNMGLNHNSHANAAPPLDTSFISAAPTPQLTMETNSPQSSSTPSTNVSTVDGPTEPTGVDGKDMPELRLIESV